MESKHRCTELSGHDECLQDAGRKGLGRRIGALGGDLDRHRLQRPDEDADEQNGEHHLCKKKTRG